MQHATTYHTAELEQAPTMVVVTPSMRLYLPRVEARLRGIIALKAYVASKAIFTTSHVI